MKSSVADRRWSVAAPLGLRAPAYGVIRAWSQPPACGLAAPPGTGPSTSAPPSLRADRFPSLAWPRAAPTEPGPLTDRLRGLTDHLRIPSGSSSRRTRNLVLTTDPAVDRRWLGCRRAGDQAVSGDADSRPGRRRPARVRRAWSAGPAVAAPGCRDPAGGAVRRRGPVHLDPATQPVSALDPGPAGGSLRVRRCSAASWPAASASACPAWSCWPLPTRCTRKR